MDISKEIKMVNDEWIHKLNDCEVNYSYLKYVLDSIDAKLKDMERELEESGVGGIGYSSRAYEIDENHDKIISMSEFIRALPQYMSDIDKSFCNTIQNGAVYKLSQI